ncbi:MAG: hypothetical protein U1F70_00545 [Candidatus Competibacteraceae bacterium]
MFVPLEHLGEKELAEAGIGFGFGHEAQEFIGVAEEGVLDAAIESLYGNTPFKNIDLLVIGRLSGLKSHDIQQ